MGTVLTAAGTAILVLLGGSLPWAGFGPIDGLGAWNLRTGVLVPWAVVPMVIYLWAYFGYIGGRWGQAGAARRRENLRANDVPGVVWAAALPAGLLGFGAILALLAVIARLVSLPPGAPISSPAGMPSDLCQWRSLRPAALSEPPWRSPADAALLRCGFRGVRSADLGC
jgi:hypothetical protein